MTRLTQYYLRNIEMGIRRKYKGEETVEAPPPEQEAPAEVRRRKPKECTECGHPKKQTRRFEMTPARKAAWEKCVKARDESLKNHDRDKEIKKLEKAQKTLEEKRKALGITWGDTSPHPPASHNSQSLNNEEVLCGKQVAGEVSPAAAPKARPVSLAKPKRVDARFASKASDGGQSPPRRAKRVVLVESESESESDDDCEFIIEKVRRAREPEARGTPEAYRKPPPKPRLKRAPERTVTPPQRVYQPQPQLAYPYQFL